MAADGLLFSDDGYAVDQTQARHLPYGRHGSHYNGCGWMAAYNVLRALGLPVTADAVRAQLARGLRFGGSLGTGPLRFARYLRAQGAAVNITPRRDVACRRAQTCRAGAVFYWNGRHNGAHYAAFAPVRPAPAAQAVEQSAPRGGTAPAQCAAQGKPQPALAANAQRQTPAKPASAPGGGQTSAPPAARALRFFNAQPGARSHVQTLAAFCAGHCAGAPALFFTVE